MNEETEAGKTLIEYRLDQIEKKLDEVTKLLVQTQGQEIRIGVIEGAISELKKNKDKNIDRWLNPLISAIIAGIVSFIFIRIGLK
jgi:pyruvate kinase